MLHPIFRNHIVKAFLIATLVALPLVPLAARADATMPNIWPTGYWAPGGIVSCTAFYSTSANDAAQMGKPYCTSIDNLVQTVLNALALGMSIAIFIVAPVSFVSGGVMMMLSGANPEMLGQSKRLLTGTVIGILIVLCSYLILNTVLTLFNVAQCFGGFGSGCKPSS